MAGNIIALTASVDGGAPKTFKGRFAQTLDLLLQNGEDGLSSLESPGIRLSHYVFVLRREGVDIVTDDERHAGPYAGCHARYKLTSPVEVISREFAS
jgi:hypothetical protein